MEKLRVAMVTIFLALAGCQAGAQPTPVTPTPEPTSTGTPVPPTFTPTATSTQTPTVTATVTPTRTETPDRNATSTAIALATWDALSAQARTELESLGLPTNGELAWFEDEPALYSLEDYATYIIDPVADGKYFKDFIMHVEIAWSTSSGLAGCGIAFRMVPPVYDGQAYHFQTLRLAGAPAFAFEYWKNNYREAFLTGDYKFHDAIDVKNQSTNVYDIHVQGDNMNAYANGKKIGYATYTKLPEGLIGLMAMQESGDTTCMFDKMWIWELK